MARSRTCTCRVFVVAYYCSGCSWSGWRRLFVKSHFRRFRTVAIPYTSVLGEPFKLSKGACQWGIATDVARETQLILNTYSQLNKAFIRESQYVAQPLVAAPSNRSHHVVRFGGPARFFMNAFSRDPRNRSCICPIDCSYGASRHIPGFTPVGEQ